MGRKMLHPSMDEIDLAHVLNALGDPVRLEIVQNIAKNGTMSCQSSCTLSLAKSTLSHHFRVLREAGIIISTKEGVMFQNCLRREELNKKFPGLLDSVIKLHHRDCKKEAKK